jgi:hypothetical protein
LWVRETWQYTGPELNEDPGYVYRATDPYWESMEGWKWRPSVHMPRCASRLTLEITEVGIERLNDLSEADAKAEGTENRSDLAWGRGGQDEDIALWAVNHGHRYAFCDLWESINGPGSWAANPWVWVVKFRWLTDE